MAISGASVLQQLRGSLGVARSNLEQLRKQSRDLETELQRLVAERGQAIAQLAHHYLPDISATAVRGAFGDVQTDLADILRRKETRRDDLLRTIKTNEEQCRALHVEIEAIDAELSALGAKRKELEEHVASELAADADFQQLTKLSLASEKELQRHDARVKDLEREAHEKLPAYEHSALFQYLYKRNWGTAQYAYKGWTRDWDRWVADLIGFARAKRSYEFLKRTPQLVADEVAARRADFDALMEQIEARRDVVVERIGLQGTIDQQTNVEQRRIAAGRRLAEAEQGIAQAHQKLNGLDAPESEFYAEAISRVRDYLAQTQTTVLAARARKTPQTIDDDLVARIQMLGDEIGKLKPEHQLVSQTVQTTSERADALDRVVQRFVAANYDAGRSIFDDGLDARTWADRLMTGRCDESALWRQVESQQTWMPTIVTHSGNMMNDMAASPWSNVMLEAMAQVAGAAARGMAESAARRRHGGGANWDWSIGSGGNWGSGGSSWDSGGNWSSGGSSWDSGSSSSSSSSSSSDSSSSGGGFFTSDSF